MTRWCGRWTWRGVWRRGEVEPRLWLRWLEPMVSSEDPRARLELAVQLADLPSLAARGDAAGLLATLADDEDAAVRYAALITAGELAGHIEAGGTARAGLIELIGAATRDENAVIARHAWIIAGLLDAPPPLPEEAAATMEAQVLDAAAWALAQTQETRPAVVQLLRQHDSPRVQATAVYALATHATRPEVAAAMQAVLDRPAGELTPDEATLIWRALLAAPGDGGGHAWRDAVRSWADPEALHAPRHPQLVAAAVHRLGEGARGVVERDRASGSANRRLWLLAWLEGLPRGGADVAIRGDDLPAIRLAAARAKRDLTADDLMPLLTSESPPLRDAAAALAAKRLPEAEAMRLADELMRSFDDAAIVSGAMIAALADVRPTTVLPYGGEQKREDLLAYRVRIEDDPTTRELLEVALWARGDREELAPSAEVSFRQEVVPRSTLLLAMLHRGGAQRSAALDLLWNPRGEPMVDPDRLLVSERWWRVLAPYLDAVEEDHPPLWLWADPQLRALQIDVLRDWWLVRRGAYADAGARDREK